MFGFGSQYAFNHYLNYFVKHSKFRFQYDDVFSSEFSLPSDFRIFFPNQAFWVEVKSTPPNLSYCRYYKSKRDPNPYPDYCVVVKALDEEMLNYEVYGYCKGSHVQGVKPKDKGISVVHEIPLNRHYFRPYSDFHEDIARAKFDDEHYVNM